MNTLTLTSLRIRTLDLPVKRRGAYDGRIVNVASEMLDFIDGRKHFWALQAHRHGPDAKAWVTSYVKVTDQGGPHSILVAFMLHTQQSRVRFLAFLNFRGNFNVAELIDHSRLLIKWIDSIKLNINIYIVDQTHPVLARGTLYCKKVTDHFIRTSIALI